MDARRGLNQTTNSYETGLATPVGDFKERVSYDGGGNILSYLRQGKGSTLVMDSLSYKYDRDAQGRLTSNRLLQVRDRVSNSTAHSANYASDIEDQAAGNYSYDAIGNLIKDNQEGITNITWNVYGKITEIQKSAAPAGSVSNIRYSYDASGNRISKRVQRSGSDSATYTWYVRDATGNVMAIYSSRGVNTAYSDYSLLLKEQHLYGSSRLGILKRNADQKVAATQRTAYSLVRGNKLFELTNHLGNVLAVVSDRKIGQSSGGTTVDYYEAEVMQAQDYYPFGMQMPGRSGYEQRGEAEADESGSSSLQNDLVVTSRTNNQPSEYKALNSITFDPDFESAEGDSFEAFPTTSGSQGSSSGSIAHGWVDNSTSTAGAFRYGFNGKENDNETYGEGNAYDFGARIYDPRIGRWLSTDPMQKNYPHLSPYNSFENNPIYFDDPDGKDAGITMKGNTITISTKIYIYGSAATSANALIMQQDIMSSWSKDQNGNNWSYRDQATGTIYNVKFDVQVELYDKTNPSKEPGFFSGRNNPINTDNYIEVGNNSNTSFVKGSDEGEWRGQGRGGKTLVQDNPAAHEFGHLIRLDDRYSSSGALPTWNGNVMAEPAGLGVVEQKNIDAILKPQVDRFNKSATKFLNDKLKTNLEYKTKIDESNPSWERDKEKKQKSN